MAGRLCKQCAQHSIHRAPNKSWEKVVTALTGMRRDRCYSCGAREWVADPYRSAQWQPLAVIALLVVLLLLARAIADPAPRAVRDDAPLPLASAKPAPAAPPAVTAVVAPAATLPAAAAEPEPEPAATTAAAAAPQLPEPESAPEPSKAPADARPQVQRHQLLAVTPRWTGSEMEVLVQADAIPETYTLIYVASSGGYVLDLPGVWQISPQIRRSRSFTRSNLTEMDVGLHPTFLRLVFRTLQPEPAPRISVDERVLRVLL